MIRPRHGYEVTATDVSMASDHQAAFVLVDTAGDLDFSLRVSRDTLVQLKTQIDLALDDQAPRAALKKDT